MRSRLSIGNKLLLLAPAQSLSLSPSLSFSRRSHVSAYKSFDLPSKPTHDTNRNRTRIACESDVKFKAATKKKLLAALSAQSDNVRPVGSIVDRTTTRDLKLEISENSLYAMKPVIFTSVVIAATLACLATPTSGQFNRRQGMETNKTNTIEYIIYIL